MRGRRSPLGALRHRAPQRPFDQLLGISGKTVAPAIFWPLSPPATNAAADPSGTFGQRTLPPSQSAEVSLDIKGLASNRPSSFHAGRVVSRCDAYPVRTVLAA